MRGKSKPNFNERILIYLSHFNNCAHNVRIAYLKALRLYRFPRRYAMRTLPSFKLRIAGIIPRYLCFNLYWCTALEMAATILESVTVDLVTVATGLATGNGAGRNRSTSADMLLTATTSMARNRNTIPIPTTINSTPLISSSLIITHLSKCSNYGIVP